MPVSPPKKWFDSMRKKVKKQYPTYSDKRIDKIVAGIWYKKYKPRVKNRISKKVESNPKSLLDEIEDFLKELWGEL